MFPERRQEKNSLSRMIYSPEDQVYLLHTGTDGWIALCKKQDGLFKQRHYKLTEIAANLPEWVDFDSYVSMNTFFSPKRLVTNLRELRAVYVDLDCYKIERTPVQIVMELQEDFFGTMLPTPNLINYSGRGVNLIWFIEPISGLAVERWDKLQQAIVAKVESLGADGKAVDAARVFRLAGSINSRNNEIVYADLLHEYRYGFQEIVEEYFPDILKSVQPPKKPKKKLEKRKRGVSRLFNEYTLIKARMSDIERLTDIRSGNMEGSREYALFLYRYWALAQHENKEVAQKLMLKLNCRFSEPLPEREALRDTKSAERYYESDEPFKITNEKVIKWLNITTEEQQQLDTIISRGEKNRRKRLANEEMRRSAGRKSMNEYNNDRKAKKAENAARLAELKTKHPEATQKELGALMGVSDRTIRNLLKEIQ